MSRRVLVVTNMWPVASDPGFGSFVWDQVEACRALGLQLDVVFVNGRAARRAYLAEVLPVRRRLREGDYEVLHAHHTLAGAVAWMARWPSSGPPLLLTHHGIEVFEGWQAPLARWMTHRADRTLVVSPPMAAHLGLPPEAVLPMGVDTRLFKTGDQSAAKATLGIDDEAMLIAWVGADRPEKRLGLARAAVDLLRETIPTARLLAVSGAPRADVARVLQAADAFVLTSTREGAPVAVKEALACGLPVVSTDVGDVRALIDGLDGCAVVTDDPRDIARALDRAVRRGHIDATAAVAPYSIDALARRMARVYDEVASHHAAGRRSRKARAA